MSQLEEQVAQSEGRGVSSKWWSRDGFLLCGVALIALVVGYYLVVVRFQKLLAFPAYTFIPDPYLPLVAFLLFLLFVYRYRTLLWVRLRDDWARTVVILLSLFVLTLGSAGAVREVGYRLPGLRIQVDWEGIANSKVQIFLRGYSRWCIDNGGDCSDEAYSLMDAEVAEFEAFATRVIIKNHWVRYAIVEMAALAAVIAALLGLHRLIMSGSLQTSRYRLLNLFNRYGDEP